MKDKFFIAVVLAPLAFIVVSVFVVTLEKQRIQDLYKDHNISVPKVFR